VNEHEKHLFLIFDAIRSLGSSEDGAMTRMRCLQIVAAAVLLGQSAVALGIIGRHDVDGALYASYADLFPSTCMITLDGSCIGSGVLITPGYVLTAAHVARLFDGSGEAVHLSDGRVVGVSQSMIYPFYSGLIFDIAIVRMEYGVPDIIPTPPYDSFLSPGMDISLAGYGVIGDGIHGAWDGIAGEALWAATNRVESVFFDSSEFTVNLDAPGSGSATVLEGLGAPGDSGGPTFLWTSDGWRVCGLISRGSERLQYGNQMISTQVAPYLDSFVVAAMSEWGEPPLYVPSPSAFVLTALGVTGVARRRLRDAFSIQDRNRCS
jgi:hypothetical protein